MKAKIEYKGKIYNIDLLKPLDISMPLKADQSNPTAWYVNPPEFNAVMENGFIGDVNLGGSVNFRNIFFNPHGHGTHTECVGHISKEFYTLNKSLTRFLFVAEVITVLPEQLENGDYVITEKIFKILR